MRLRFVLLVPLALALAASAQEFRGRISGEITDATGSSVAGAKVTVTEINTSTKAEAASDAAGRYNVPFLLAGDYDIAVSMSGFKEFVRKGIHLGAGESPNINVRLEVGDTRQIVEVTAEAPAINSDNASVGQAITAREVEDLPSNGGTPTALLAMAPGVIATAQPTQVLPFASGNAASFSMSGMPNQQNEILTDGVPNTTWDGRLAYSPPKDAVQEVRTKVFDTDAAYGHTGGGTANTILKSGRNVLNGTVSWYNQPNNLTANNFFNNKNGLPAAVTHYNQGSVTASGPLWIPKIFDGRNKVFWMFAFEDIQSTSPNTYFLTVPTTALRQGDFSPISTILYDPNTAAYTTGTAFTRTPFPGNKIPANRLNGTSLKYLDFIPAPNVAGGANGYQNYGSNEPTKDGFTNELGRLDFNTGTRSRTYFNMRHTDYFQTKNNYFRNISTGSNLSRSNWGGSLDQVFILDSANILNLRLNFTRMFEDHAAPSAGFSPASLGFPAYMNANSNYLQLPVMSFASVSGFTTLGMNGANTLPSQSLQLFGTWSTIRGGHSIKAGVDLRQYRLNYSSAGNSTGAFSFNGNSWVRAGSTSSSTAFGQDWASFLLGLPYTSSGSVYDVFAAASFYQYYGGAFVQDDWRVTPSLTLNIGLRYDRDFPWREKWGRSVNGFDLNAAGPLAAAATAAYNATPGVPIPAGQWKVPGGLTFASPDDNKMFSTSGILSPRFGFAWTPPALTDTVIRGGFGMFVAPVTISKMGTDGRYSTSPMLNQEGFNQSTTYTASNDSYFSPATTLSDPFPGGIQQPVGSSLGLATFAGQAITFFNPDMDSPYTLRWNLGIQRQFPSGMTGEIVYIGSHSVKLPVPYTQLNGIPAEFLSTLGTRDNDKNAAMSATLANPFYGLQTATGRSRTATVAQLLARYPQFPVFSGGLARNDTSGIVEYNGNLGASWYHGLNLRLTKRFSKGLQFTFGYSKTRVIEEMTWLNATDTRPEHRVSPFDRPNRFVVTGGYELPFGRGKLVNLQSRWFDRIAGGWKIAGSYIFQTGKVIVFSDDDYVYYGGKLNLQPRQVDGVALDTSRFNTVSAEQFAYHLRTFSSTFMDVRADGINQLDLSIMKSFRFGGDERRFLQLKCDAFNATNHPLFGGSGGVNSVDPANTNFGRITEQANRPRMLQLAARIVF